MPAVSVKDAAVDDTPFPFPEQKRMVVDRYPAFALCDISEFEFLMPVPWIDVPLAVIPIDITGTWKGTVSMFPVFKLIFQYFYR